MGYRTTKKILSDILSSKHPMNTNGFWLSLEEVIKRKRVTKYMVLRAIEDDKLTFHIIKGFGKSYIFIEADDKYKDFSNTSNLILDMNALIRFTNRRIKKKLGR